MPTNTDMAVATPAGPLTPIVRRSTHAKLLTKG